MAVDSMLSKILVPGKARFLRLQNADGKMWLMPERNMSVAMSLYQPGSAKGRLLKRFFPALHLLPGVKRLANATRERVDLSPEIRRVIADAFGCDSFEWALFGGTPSVHQKITIQIHAGRNILGYVKLSDSPEIRKLFEHERAVLEALGEKLPADSPLKIPKVLGCGRVSGGYYFIQSTLKSPKSGVLHEWTSLHDAALDALRKSTTAPIPFDESDYKATLIDAEPYLDSLSVRALNHRKEVLERYKGKTVDFCACHCDFTPWNMAAVQDGLFVFDWEYASLSYPPGLDRWHFLIQTALFEKRMSEDEIREMVRPLIKDDSLQLYLLEVICRFAAREKGVFKGDMARSMKLWGRLLRLFE